MLLNFSMRCFFMRANTRIFCIYINNFISVFSIFRYCGNSCSFSSLRTLLFPDYQSLFVSCSNFLTNAHFFKIKIQILFITMFNLFVGCGKEQFQCADGNCIRIEDQCNGYINCADGSDEDDCGKYNILIIYNYYYYYIIIYCYIIFRLLLYS